MLSDKDFDILKQDQFSFQYDVDFFSSSSCPNQSSPQSSNNLDQEENNCCDTQLKINNNTDVPNATNNQQNFEFAKPLQTSNYFQNEKDFEQPILPFNKNQSNLVFNALTSYNEIYDNQAQQDYNQSTATQSEEDQIYIEDNSNNTFTHQMNQQQQQNNNIMSNSIFVEDSSIVKQEEQDNNTLDLQLKEQEHHSEQIHSQQDQIQLYNNNMYAYQDQLEEEDEEDEDDEQQNIDDQNEESSESYKPYNQSQQQNRRRSQRKRVSSQRYSKYIQLYEEAEEKPTKKQQLRSTNKQQQSLSELSILQQKRIRKREVTMNYKNKRSSEETKNLPTTIGKILLKSLKKKLPQIPQLQKMKVISNKEHFQQLFSINSTVQQHAIQFLTSGPMVSYLANSTRLKQKRLVVKYLDIIVEGAIDPLNLKCFKQSCSY